MKFKYTESCSKDVKIPNITLGISSVSNSNSNTNASNSNQKNTTLTIDATKPFISIRKTAMKIKTSFKNTDICVCIHKLPMKYKFVFLNYLSKSMYTFEKYRANASKPQTVYVHDKVTSKDVITSFIHAINCADITRNLENEPANMMSPDMFAKTTQQLFKDISKYPNGHKVKITVLDEKDMKKIGLNLVLAIGMSSLRKPRFMTIECIRDKSYPTICLVGKTVVYDAGGLNIKLGKNMSPEMKEDKSGGSVVVGVIQYFAQNFVKCNIVGILPIVENLLSEDVARPGDIFKSYDGRTVEISDIDCEGRLVLADGIAYSKKYKPTYLFDLATLTGWSSSVHMDTAAVCYCRNMELAAKINDVGEKVGERVWFMPPWQEYTEFTKSEVADIRNFSLDMREGAYLPSMFLLTFVPEELRDRYVHFDICNNYERSISRGNCVSLMIELIKTLCK